MPETLTKKMMREVPGWLLVCTCLALSDSMAAFFWGHRGTMSTVDWFRDFAWVVAAGTFFNTVLLLLLAVPFVLLSVGAFLLLRTKKPLLATRLSCRLFSQLSAVFIFCAAQTFIIQHDATAISLFAVAFAVIVALYAVVPDVSQHTVIRIVIAVVLVACATGFIFWFSAPVLRYRLETTSLVTMCLQISAVPLLAAICFLFPTLRTGIVVAGTGAILLTLAALHGGSARTGSSGPDVLFIVVDTLRADRVFGPSAMMPCTAAFSKTGISYQFAHTPFPRTVPSVAAMLTSRYPWNIGVRSMGEQLASSEVTFSERMAERGYTTAAFIHNPWLNDGLGMEQGFHIYRDHDAIESVLPRLNRVLAIRAFDTTCGRKNVSRAPIDGSRLVAAFKDWINDADATPLFAWIQLFDPHWPYEPVSQDAGITASDRRLASVINAPHLRNIKWQDMIFQMEKTGITAEEIDAARRMYDAECAWTDRLIAQIIESVQKTRGADRELLVVVTADHGESLGDHGYYFHHGDNIYESGLHIPLIISWPGRIPAGVVNTQLVSNIDIFPTVARLVGAGDPVNTDGVFLPEVFSDNLAGREMLGVESSPPPNPKIERDASKKRVNRRFPQSAVRRKLPRWRGVVVRDRKLAVQPLPTAPVFELYNLTADPGEATNLSPVEPTAVKFLTDQLRSAGLNTMDTGSGPSEREPRRLSPLEMEQLKSLGYIQ